MGHGGRGNSFSSSMHSLSPSFSENRVVEYVNSQRSMASGPSCSSNCDSIASSNAGYIEHTVSRFDTLAGIAIKYGVEVGDVKRMNGLVTDLQMFALKALKIPLPGRHPPTSSSNNLGFLDKLPPPRLGKHPNPVLAQIVEDCFSDREPEKRSVTSAMGLLRGYYGLSTSARQGDEGTEMVVYKSDSDYHSEDEPFSPQRAPEPSTVRYLNGDSPGSIVTSAGQVVNYSDHPLVGYPVTGKSNFTAPFDLFTESTRGALLRIGTTGDSGVSEMERANDRLFRRRAKGESAGSVPDNLSEMSIVPEPGANTHLNIPLGKSSALRQKMVATFEQETDGSLPQSVVNIPINGWHPSDTPGLTGSAGRALGSSVLGGKAMEGLISKIRRSGSNSALHEDKRSNKTDLAGTLVVSQGSTQSRVLSGVLEGFPKPGVIRRNKAALD